MAERAELDGLPCPACRGTRTAEVDAAQADEIARAWARQPHVAEVRSEAAVRAAVRADLGTDRVRFLRCAGCGLEFADPMRAWSAGNYPDERYGLAFDQLCALQVLARTPPARLLEIGCADGRFLERAAALGHRVTGVDFYAPAVAAARARGLHVHAGDVAALQAALGADARFDVVAMFQIIEHLEDPDAVFRDIAAISRPGTVLLAGCPSDRRYTRRVAHPDRIGGSDFFDWPPQHTLRWGARSLRAFLARHGWRVDVAAYEPFTPLGAAAHVTALRRNGRGDGALRRRMETARALAGVLASRARGPLSGIRLLVRATRGGA